MSWSAEVEESAVGGEPLRRMLFILVIVSGQAWASSARVDRSAMPVSGHTDVVIRPVSTQAQLGTILPTVTIDIGPPTYTNDNTPSFGFTVVAGSTPSSPQCRIFVSAVTPPSFGACTNDSSFHSSALADGQFVFEVRAVDTQGNAGPIATLGFTIDTVAPSVVINGGWGVDTNDTTPTFNFTASAGTGSPVTVSCRVTSSPPGPMPPLGPCTTANSHTTDPLADGTYQFEVRVVDAAGNDGPNAENRVFGIDTVMPTVVSIDSVAAADWSAEGATAIDAAITRILVTFDDDMHPGSALSFANWIAVTSGANGEFETVVCGSPLGDDAVVPIMQTQMGIGSRTVSVAFNDRGLQAGRHRLIACGSITDSAGNGLDGAGNGGQSEPRVLDFNVVANPRVGNPNFDDSLFGWTSTGPWLHGSIDGEARQYSGSARLNTSTGSGATFHLDRCVPYEAGMFGVSALARIASTTSGAPSVRISLHASAQNDCSGSLGAIGNSMSVSGSTGGLWQSLLMGAIAAPPDTVALWLDFEVEGGDSSSYTVEIDRVHYPLSVPLFRDGFDTETP